MMLLDTNVVSALMRAESLPALDDVPETLVLCAPVVAEIHAGLAMLPPGRRARALADGFSTVLRQFADVVLPFDDEAAWTYGQVVAHRRSIGRPIATVDAQIAGICRANDAGLATRNTRDFEDLGLRLLDPWMPA